MIILYIIIALVVIFIFFRILEGIITKPNNDFDIYFGVPGSGKTTFAAWIAKKNNKYGRTSHSTVPIKGTYEIKKADIGYYNMSHSSIIWDEAGIDVDNRKFKDNFTPAQVKFLKLHRHYDVDIYCFSQYWNDIDVKLRNLATRLFLVQKSFWPFFIVRREIAKCIGIDEETKQIVDFYQFVTFGSKRIFAPSLWKMFNSHDREPLPKKEFKMY